MSKHAQNKRPAVVVFGAVALALAGCSGSSSDAQDEIVVRPTLSFASSDALNRRLFAEAVTASPTNTAQLPVVGTATYRGAVSYVDSNISNIPDDLKFPDYETFIINNPDYASRIRLTADFRSDTVDGSMSSFRTASDREMFINATTTSVIVNSSSDTAGFQGTLTGTREFLDADGKIQTNSFSGSIAGNFLGGRGDSILGSLAVSNGFTGEERGAVFGVFTAEQ
jgi:hypothetical protein